MPIERVKYQGEITLREYYNNNSGIGLDQHQNISINMILVTDLLNNMFKEPRFYGKTSHLNLNIETNEHGENKAQIQNIGLADFFS